MQEKNDRQEELFKRIAGMTYRGWKGKHHKPHRRHPNEETVACLVEGRLPEKEQKAVLSHIVTCIRCSEAVDLYFKTDQSQPLEVPQELLMRLKAALEQEARSLLLEIALRIKENMIEVLESGGDILVGQELMPAPVLRSRKITEFRDEIFIFRDFKDIRAEIKIENKLGGFFSMCVTAKDKKTQQVLKDIRITLLKEEDELESYLCERGAAVFEHVALGTYRIEICGKDAKLAAISLDIRS